MSDPDRASPQDVSRWDLPAVEGAPLPRPGAKGVNVMHLTLVEREAWDHGYKDGHVEGVYPVLVVGVSGFLGVADLVVQTGLLVHSD